MELRSMQKRTLLMLKEVEQETPSALLKRHIRAIETEMEAEDVAYVEKKLKES